MRRSVFTATASALAILSAGTAAAQSTEIAVGAEHQGVLNEADRSTGEDEGQYRYEDFTVRARSGQRLEAILRSDAFDAYLALYRGEAPAADAEALAEDDDGLGEGTNARVRYTAPSNGVYTLRVRTLGGLEGGAYTLSVSERAPAPRAPRPTPVQLGQQTAGTLADSDPENDEGARYDAYAFRARAGQRFALALDADDFDPVVRVGRMDRDRFEELGSNDDSVAGGLNSYLIFTAPRAGEFVARVEPIQAEGLGAYTLTVSEAPPRPTAAPLALGAEVSGELTESDGVNDGGARTDVYRIEAAAGQRIEASAASDAFDTFLELYDASGASVDSDDDGAGSGTDSKLTYTLADAGPYTLQLRGVGENPTGAYTLSLAAAAPEPAAVPLAFGAVTQGEISTGDPSDDENRHYDAYAFSGTEGNRVQVIMRSGDFDTFLQIGRAGRFEALGSDDDGLAEGTDSRLNFTLPETGDYVLRASPLGSEEKGLYSIELLDRGPQPAEGSLVVGATARGSLSEMDAIDENGASYDAYRVQVADGEKLRITMVSNDFDAFVEIGREKDGAFESLATDDDSLSDTHAKLEWDADDAGAYVIRARSFAAGQTGAYALTVERKP